MKETYIAAKERWARKMAGKEKPAIRSENRLPPGQREVQNFPVLDLGIRPDVPLDKWVLEVHGLVENSVTLNWAQFMALPQFKDVSDFHCVTTWSQFDMEFEGVAFFTLADLVKPKPEATHVFFKSYDGYSTNNPLEVCMDDDVLIAHSWNGKPLTKEHGGPARVIIPLRVEGSKICPRHSIHRPRHSRILGSPRLLEYGRPMDGGPVFVKLTWEGEAPAEP